MFGFKYIKALPHVHLMQYSSGKLKREGRGLSFFYFAPSTHLVSIPVNSVDEPFIFNEVTADFQEVTLQGQVTYRVAEPGKLAELLDFTLAKNGESYASEDPQTLSQRVMQVVQVLMRVRLSKMNLLETLASSEMLVEEVREALASSDELASMGLETLGLSVLAISPTPETSRALEADIRESLLQKADEAVYARRNAAVEQERAIRENELKTEIAIEKKKRQVREEKIEADRAVKLKQHLIRKERLAADIELEQKNKSFVELMIANKRKKADAEAYAMTVQLKAFEGTDNRVLQALASVGMDSGKLVALGFRDLAESAGKIGQLNITPDLLREMMDQS